MADWEPLLNLHLQVPDWEVVGHPQIKKEGERFQIRFVARPLLTGTQDVVVMELRDPAGTLLHRDQHPFHIDGQPHLVKPGVSFDMVWDIREATA